jgi:Na+/H+-dicarboxylate symporter
VVAVLDPIGTLWVNAIRMVVVPLVVSLIATTVAAGDVRGVGRLGFRTMVVFVGLSLSIAALGILVAPPVFGMLSVDPAVAPSLRALAQSSIGTTKLPPFADWLVGLVPANPIRAASEGAMLPLLVFAVAFGLALGRSATPASAMMLRLLRAVADAMLTIVGWVLALAPIGVFALAASVTARAGASVVGAIGFFIAAHGVLLVLAIAVIYLAVLVTRAAPIRRFARAALPAQAVALGSRSSVAALPASLDAADTVLGLPARVASFVLPLGVSVFRPNSGVSWVASGLFVGKLYGVELGIPEVALLGLMAVPLTFSVPGVPSGGLLLLASVFLSVGLPVEGIGILIAVDAIPDAMKTWVNVTGQLATATIVSRWEGTAARSP